MPTTYNVTLKPEASPEELQNAKKEVESKGGKITHEFSLIKGFTAELPDDLVSTFESNDKITVEKDSEVTTQ
ncbi:hypothetical protein N0V95_008512 [Ascochyta clinopodiicola]|jgi:hypothetical protein|uniref:Inhibitor I9 domain-containing protein n=2 Tax=Ascochyta TaxID=5453 RepID=A0A8H7IY15_9PLEO|nr:uncharacterized protein EKO05_0000731 [Ascochyta rabiei]KAF9693223.1 hypothetical protein EKO04_008663 [Ascochyta lentis]KAJ4336815.1 hypothetical protein N0V95_008512 [Ascochyta clinopodiicola]KZM21542.1 hypothetical protein ST47_g7304 [Ascochyta rabiei]UPX10059.1 hypothetical protein EKO05_0000731 [Ascochyta rabiei]